MELVTYAIEGYLESEDAIKDSIVYLKVNHEGEESVSYFHDSVIVHNCTVNDVLSDSKKWRKYFKIFDCPEENGVVIAVQQYQPFKITKVNV
jgi:hypothetical protein